MGEQTTQRGLILEYYKKRPNKDIEHAKVVDWSLSEWKKRTGKTFRDPDRAIRKLHEEGILLKIGKGVYRYDPSMAADRGSEDFTQDQKNQILERDGYRCCVCGLGKEEGLEIQVDHIKPKDKGGKAEVSNGQVLCGRHNYMKHTYNQTETGKRIFIHLYEVAVEEKDEKMQAFCKDVLEVYEQHGIDGHIKR